MSRYTTEVRFICEQCIGLEQSQDRPAVESILKQAYPLIFDSDLGLYNPDTNKVDTNSSHKEELFTKILRHYYTREIGLETAGLWKLKLNTRMREILPYYNQLYQSANIEYNPLLNIDVTDTHDEDRTDDKSKVGTLDSTVTGSNDITQSNSYGQTTETQTPNHTTAEAYSDTPQGSLSGVQDKTYLTSYKETTVTGGGDTIVGAQHSDTLTTDQDTRTVTDTGTTATEDNKYTTDYTHRKYGKDGTMTYQEMILKYRETFLNIDMMIIDELKDLFMGLW